MKKAGQENIHHLFSCLFTMGIKQVFVCPGSRNAPLINGAISQNFNIQSVTDERSAAYMAIGAAQVSQKPVILICTSGTALLNFFPAIAEAKQMQIPLIVLSADRPQNLINRWENQAIDQKKIFGNYVNTYFDWKGIMELKRSFGKVERLAAKMQAHTQFPDPGPVHVNFHLSEPLYIAEPIKTIAPFALSTHIKSHTPPVFSTNNMEPINKTLIVSGSGKYVEQHAKEIEALVQKGALLFADLTSPYRHLQSHSDWEITLNFLAETEWKKHKPKTLITTGTFLLNKNIKNLIRKAPPAQHIHLADCKQFKDTFFSKPLLCKSLGESFIDKTPSNTEFTSLWIEKFEATSQKINTILSNTKELSDLWVVYQFAKVLPQNSVLHVANSMSVRYAAIVGIDKSIKILANRGTSGIDGCLSTAVGAALAQPENNHFLICGDLAFFYDINALWIQHIPQNLKVLLLNNKSGNIFDMIPGPASSKGYELFTTPHKRTAKHIAQDFGIDYLHANSQSEWKAVLPEFISKNGFTLLEISTNPTTNKELWNQLKK